MPVKRLVLVSFILVNTLNAQTINPCVNKWNSNVDVPASCWALKADSKYRNAGTDGKDIGANIPLIDAMTRCVISGGVDKVACTEYEKLRIEAYEFNAPRDLRILRWENAN